MKIVLLFVTFVIMSVQVAQAGYKTPKDVVTAFLQEEVKQSYQRFRQLPTDDSVYYKMFSKKGFDSIGSDIALYEPDFWAVDDYAINSVDQTTGIIKATIYSHAFQLQHVLIFKTIKEKGSYKIAPGKITPLNRNSANKGSFDPWQQAEAVDYNYSGEPTKYPPRFVGLPKPFGLDFGKTTESEAINKLTQMGGKITNNGFRVIAKTNYSNPDIRLVFFSGVPEYLEIIATFYKSKLYSLYAKSNQGLKSRLKDYRQGYGEEMYNLRKEPYWSWAEVKRTGVRRLSLEFEVGPDYTFDIYQMNDQTLRLSDENYVKLQPK